MKVITETKVENIQDMYIVTNTCSTGSYTPTKTDTLEAAQEWMLECTSNNIRIATRSLPDSNMTNEEVIEWMKVNWMEEFEDFSFTETTSYIGYSDGTFNEMKIFNIKDL